jgi:hypothetical protein
MSDRSLLVDALLGAVVAVVLAFLPLSTLLGGAAAGYLHRDDGLKVGALAGVFASLPLLGVLLFVAGLLGVFVPVGFGMNGMGVPLAAPLALGVLLFGLVTLLLVYAVGLSALGGLLGVSLAEEFDGDEESDRPAA